MEAEIVNLKPIIYDIKAFDANRITENNPLVMKYKWNGSFISYKSELKIYSEAGTLLVTHQYNSLSPAHIIHENDKEVINKLKQFQSSQEKIYVTMTLYNKDQSMKSVESDKFYLVMYDTPTFSIANLTNDQTITSSKIDVAIEEGENYIQNQNKQIYSYKFYLYDETKSQLLDESPELFYLKPPDDESTAALNPEQYSYSFDVDDASSYYIIAKGTVVGGMEIACEYRINVSYEKPVNYSAFKAVNNENGTITLQVDITPVKYEWNPSVLSYENNDAVILNGENDYVSYSGFRINDNFTLQVVLKKMTKDKQTLLINMDAGTKIMVYPREKSNITYRAFDASLDENYLFIYDGVKYVVDTEEKKFYIEAVITDNENTTSIFSDSFDVPSDSQQLQIGIRRENNLYGLHVNVIEGGEAI